MSGTKISGGHGQYFSSEPSISRQALLQIQIRFGFPGRRLFNVICAYVKEVFVLIKFLNEVVNNFLNRLEEGPDGADFPVLASEIEPKQAENPLLEAWRTVCLAKVKGDSLSLKELPSCHENNKDLNISVRLLYGIDTAKYLEEIRTRIVQKEMLSSWDIVELLAISENPLQPSYSSILSFVCGKLLLYFELYKKIRLVPSNAYARLLAMSALSCLFLNHFEQKQDWRFFNTSVKINDILYHAISRHRIKTQCQIKYLARLLAWRAFSIQERTFYNMEKQ